MIFNGKALKYGDNVDTDVIIPARYLNTIDKKELASHCMEDIDKSFVSRVQAGDIISARGYGKYIVRDLSEHTKKGRIRLFADKYI